MTVFFNTYEAYRDKARNFTINHSGYFNKFWYAEENKEPDIGKAFSSFLDGFERICSIITGALFYILELAIDLLNIAMLIIDSVFELALFNFGNAASQFTKAIATALFDIFYVAFAAIAAPLSIIVNLWDVGVGIKNTLQAESTESLTI